MSSTEDLQYLKANVDKLINIINEYTNGNKSSLATRVVFNGTEFTLNDVLTKPDVKENLFTILNSINDRLSQKIPNSYVSPSPPPPPPLPPKPFGMGGKNKKKKGGRELNNLGDPAGQISKFYNLTGLSQTPNPYEQAGAVNTYNDLRPSVVGAMSPFSSGITSSLGANINNAFNPSLVGGKPKKNKK